MKLSHKTLIVISGLIWLAMGVYLLQLGLGFLVGGLNQPEVNLPLINWLTKLTSSQEFAAIILILLASYIGYFKGRFVLGKSAKRGVKRIYSFDDPAPLHRIYDAKYYLIIGLMVALGMSIKFLGLSNDIRGFVDVLIGSALVNGAIVYFRLVGQEKAQNQT